MTHLIPLILLYLCLGVGCTIALRARIGPSGGSQPAAVEMALLLVAWPLYAPFCLATSDGTHDREAPARGPTPIDDDALGDGPGVPTEDDLLDALRRAGGTPLSDLLPDIDTGRRLAQRLSVARRHIDDINRMLVQERFSEDAALARRAHYLEQGDHHGAELVANRVQIIRRLGHMRDRFEREIQDIVETLTQLEIHAEIVRMAGTANDDTRHLVEDLFSRLQGLEVLMSETYPGEAAEADV